MQERPSASISLIAWGIVSGYSPPCSMVSKRRPVPSRCGSCGRFSGVISANLWVSFIRGPRNSTKHKSLDQKVSGGEHAEDDRDDDGPPHQGHAPAHKSSRMPLKKGWRTLPSADFARYSISANSDGSTQIPRCPIFLA